jgi:DNA-binding NarL/FixJ family response regulator
MRERIRLLIIDENPIVRQALATRLSTIPELDVLEGADGLLDVERTLQQKRPDVVLVEPKRLNGHGMELIASLASSPEAPMIIVLTSYRDDTEELVAMELGISCYMLKDIDSQALVDTILACHRGMNFRSGPL